MNYFALFLTVHYGVKELQFVTGDNHIKSYKCDSCEKYFGALCHLARHYKYIHIRSKDHYCDKCNKSFTFKDDLIKHTKRVHDEKKVVTEFICDECAKKFPNKPALNIHLIQCHDKTYQATENKQYQCDRC